MMSSATNRTTRAGSGIGTVLLLMPGDTRLSKIKLNNRVTRSVTSTMSIRSGWSRLRLYQLIFLVFLSLPGWGQVKQLERFEVPLIRAQNENYRVSSIQERGLLLYRRIMSKDGMVLEVIRLDTSLRQVWKGYIEVDRNVLVQEVVVFNYDLFILLHNTSKIGGNFQVLTIGSDKGNYKTYRLNNLIRFTPQTLVVTKAAFFIGGYFNYRPLVLHYGISTDQTKVLPGFLEP